MTIVIILFLCAAIILPIAKRKSKYTFVFSIGFIIIDVIIFCLISYIATVGVYNYVSKFDYYLFKVLRLLKITIFEIKTVMVVSIGLFMTLMHFMYVNKDKSLVQNIVFGICNVLFIAINTSWFAEYVYLWSYDIAPQYTDFLHRFTVVVPILSNCFIGVMCFLPYIRLMREYFGTRLIYEKKNLISVTVILGFMQLLFLWLLYAPPLRQLWNSYDIYMIKWIDTSHAPERYGSVIAIVILSVIGTVAVKTNVLNEMCYGRLNLNSNKKHFDVGEIWHIFHTNKNNMMLVLALAEKAISVYGKEGGLSALYGIKEQIMDFSSQIDRLITPYHSGKINFESIQLAECASAAIAKFERASEVPVAFIVECESSAVFGDKYKLTEVFYNLISNSGYAVSGVSDGLITVRIWREKKWVCASVFDNGIGMTRKTMRNLGKQFFTTKRSFGNMGLGLSYCRKVTKSHGGHIDCVSKYKKYSEFQIIMPIDD